MPRTKSAVFVCCAASLVGATTALGQAPAGNVPAAAQSEAVKAAPARTFKDANELLTALETADKDLRSLAAEIRYKKIFSQVQGGDSQIREGTLTFVITPAQAAVPAQQPGADGAGGAAGASLTSALVIVYTTSAMIAKSTTLPKKVP